MAAWRLLGLAAASSITGSESSDGLFSGFFGSSASPDFAEAEFAPLLEFYGEEQRELVAADLPLRACTNQRQPAPVWLRPFVSSRLRLAPDRASPRRFSTLSSALMLRQTSPQRGFCKWLGMAGVTYRWMCEDCSRNACAKAASFVPGTHDLAVDLPPQGDACVWLEQLPNGANKVRVTWEQRVDHWVLGRIALGAVLVWFHVHLRESTALHAALGGVGSLGVVLIVVAWWFVHSARGAINGSIPLGGLLTSTTMLLCVLLPSLREALVSIVKPNSGTDFVAWLNLREPVFNLPVGWIALVSALLLALSTIVLGARWSLRHFASAPEVEGEVAFSIGSDGRRIDILPPTPLPQRCLGWLLWLLGLTLLLQSTYLDTCSLALTLLIFSKDSIVHYACQRVQAVVGSEFEPYSLRPLVPMKAFDEQGKQHTAAALAQLQYYVQRHGDMMGRVREDTELRVRRFSDGCGHFHHPGDYGSDGEPARGWCSVL